MRTALSHSRRLSRHLRHCIGAWQLQLVSSLTCVAARAPSCQAKREHLGDGWMRAGETAQELCESRDGRPGLPVPNKSYGLCGRKAALEEVLN